MWRRWEWWAIVVYLFMLYLILAEPDTSTRKLSRLQFEIRMFRKLAEFFGSAVIDAEVEYYAVLDSQRTI